MKSIGAIRVATTLCFAAVVVFWNNVSAGQTGQRHQHRYRLVEIGTFGGSNSLYQGATRIARNDGTVVGAANTSTPDPYSPDCFDDTCFVLHAWRWHNGVLTDLGVLPDGYRATPTQSMPRA